MISILCPSRGRPENFGRMTQSARETACNPVEVMGYVDDDDNSAYPPPLRIHWPTQERGQKEITIEVIRGPRITHSDYWNVLALKAHGDILMMCGDDVIFRTKGWDTQVEEAFASVPDRILCAFPDDMGPARGKFASLPIISRRWLEIAGSFTGSGYVGDWADTHLNDIADMIGRKKFVPIVCEHMHHTFRKSKIDQTYQETLDRMAIQNPGKLYRERLPERQAIAAKLKAAIQ